MQSFIFLSKVVLFSIPSKDAGNLEGSKPIGLFKINDNMPVEHKSLALALWLQKISGFSLCLL
jgi:hypothetical protein